MRGKIEVLQEDVDALKDDLTSCHDDIMKVTEHHAERIIEMGEAIKETLAIVKVIQGKQAEIEQKVLDVEELIKTYKAVNGFWQVVKWLSASILVVAPIGALIAWIIDHLYVKGK